jgi:hypothetical protein
MQRFKKKINISPQKIGVERRQELLDNIFENQGFFPKPVLIEDMDNAFIDYISNVFPITVNGEKIPVIFLTIQRWSEFTRTWKFTDKYKDIKMPFITIVKRPDVQEGTNQAGLWNVAGKRVYTTYKVPTNYGGGRKGIDLYQIPQPTSVDITYEVRLFTNKMKSTNLTHETIYKAFKSRQHYIYPNQHPMPITLENTGDESTIDDFENRRFYIIMYEMKLAGYILDEKDFIVTPAIDRTCLVLEVEEELQQPKFKLAVNRTTKSVTYGVIFQSRANQNFNFVSEYDIRFTEIANIENVTNIQISVNGILRFNGLVLSSPLIVSAGDTIYISISKDFTSVGKFQLLGFLID